MIIKELKLINFLSHKDSTVQFRGNINVIIGHNGAGKSSIIDGIMFGLFRETLRGVRKQEDIIRRGASTGEVELTLYDSNKTYIIRRNLSVRTLDDNIIMLDENGKRILLTRGASSTTEKVTELLTLDRTTLESTVIIGQGKIESVFDDLPDTIKKVLKIDKIEELRDSKGVLRDLETETETELKMLDRVEDERKKTEEEKKRKEQELTGLQMKIDVLLKEKAKIETKLKELEEKVREGEEKEKKHIQLKTELNKLQTEIDRLKGDIAEEQEILIKKQQLEQEIRDLDQLRKHKEKLIEIKGKIELKKNKEKSFAISVSTLEELKEKLKKKNENRIAYEEYLQIVNKVNELKEKENQYNRIVAQIENIKSQIMKLQSSLTNYNVREEDLIKIDSEINELNKKYEEKQSKKNELNKEYGELQGRMNELTKILSNLDEVKENRCPVCGRELDEQHKSRIKEEIKDKLMELRRDKEHVSLLLNLTTEELINLNKELERKRKEKEDINKKLSEYYSFKKQLEELNEKEKQSEEKEKELLPYHEEYVELNKRLEELKEKYNEYLKYSDIDEKKVEKLEIEVEEMKREIEELVKETSEYEQTDVDKEIEKINEKIKDLENKQTLLKNIESKLALIEEKKKQLENNLKELESLNESINSLGFNEEEFSRLKNEKESIGRQLNQLLAEEQGIKGKAEVLENDIRSLEQKLSNYDEELKRRQTVREAYNKVKKMRDSLSEKKLQAYLMSTVKKMIENRLNEILSKFDLSFTMIELNFNEKNGIYAYTQNGQRLHINMLSGGERVSVAIALRLAIAKSLMNDIGFMILDEPTVNLDEYRKRELIDIIKSTTEVLPQIIVVTHDEELLQAGDYVIRLEKRGDSSKIIEEMNDNEQK